jgi:GH24 family phage-related lysozyme (muramidase)
MPAFSEKALQLILDHEGMNQPENWPGGQSGITIGIGYDLGYVTVDQFESDWGYVLSKATRARLTAVVGLRAVRAKNRAPTFAGLRLKRADAETVFRNKTIPLFRMRAAQAFPGLDLLPIDTQGALVSLVYNRGTSMVDDSPDDRRREMRAIRDAVAARDLAKIAAQLRAMKRLWQGKGLDGLIERREAEAALVDADLNKKA